MSWVQWHQLLKGLPGLWKFVLADSLGKGAWVFLGAAGSTESGEGYGLEGRPEMGKAIINRMDGDVPPAPEGLDLNQPPIEREGGIETQESLHQRNLLLVNRLDRILEERNRLETEVEINPGQPGLRERLDFLHQEILSLEEQIQRDRAMDALRADQLSERSRAVHENYLHLRENNARLGLRNSFLRTQIGSRRRER